MNRFLAVLYCLLMFCPAGAQEKTREWQGRLQDDTGEWNCMVYKLWDRSDGSQTGTIFLPVDDFDGIPLTSYQYVFTQRAGKGFAGRIWHNFFYQWLDVRYSWAETSDGLSARMRLSIDILPGMTRNWEGTLHRRW